MNQAELQQLAEDRLLDAGALLAAGRWSGAFYLAGYAVECGLKSCIMRRIITTGVIFEGKKYSEKCWTHSFPELGYTEILKVTGSLKNPNLDPIQIRLIGSNDPLARAVLDMAKPYDGRLPARYRGDFLGNMSIEGSYFYPLPTATALTTP